MRGLTGYDGFYTVYNGFSTNSKFHPAKKKHNFPSWKTNLALRPLNSENNVDFLCKFVLRLKCVEG